jgi:molybdopterin molybdotransferase
MITIADALAAIRRHAVSLAPQTISLAEANGHVLAADVVSDVDSPPFDKSMMDGVAIRAADFENGLREFTCVAEILAGSRYRSAPIGHGQATKIMTGAPLPAGADTVVMIEETEWDTTDNRAGFRITPPSCRPGQNVMRRATTMRSGTTIMSAGTLVRPADIGVLAEGGAAVVSAIPHPSLALVATGDELVPVSDVPVGPQIRNSNGPMLEAMAGRWCRQVANLGICRDDAAELNHVISRGLQADVLVLSGGVSAGVADLVPGVLRQLGVQEVFHKVAIKPGKPIWFGVGSPGQRGTLVFGLPGNPVSSLCCFHVFVLPALQAMAGRPPEQSEVHASLASDFRQRGGRTVYWPSRVTGDANPTVQPLDWKGSADLLTLARANAFAIFPGDCESFQAGQQVRVLPF